MTNKYTYNTYDYKIKYRNKRNLQHTRLQYKQNYNTNTELQPQDEPKTGLETE